MPFTLPQPPTMRWIENRFIRLGVDLGKGGAITYLDNRSDGRNMVNDFDLGRQIQMSFYSGPIPFAPGGQRPNPDWTELGWNPIQSGDSYGNPSRLLAFRQSSQSLYVKCVPMQWPLKNVPGECVFESWIKLDGRTAHVRQRITNRRSDPTQYEARTQELPAIYTNAPWYHLFSYTGSRPFQGDVPTELPHVFMWKPFWASENWAALLDDSGKGIGVVEPGVFTMSGGFFGAPGTGGSQDSPTGYISPNRSEILDGDIAYPFSFDLVVGNLAQIRQVASASHRENPTFCFNSSRSHWSCVNATDDGWRTHGAWTINLERNDPQLISPPFMIGGKSLRLKMEAAFHLHTPRLQLFWKTLHSPTFSEAKSVWIDVGADGRFQSYTFELKNLDGPLTQLRIDPEPGGAPGDWAKIRKISLLPNP